ncbi:unnamed protein product [Tuber melanosporum]|uniref:(Perigord truffle) hypothetical protein n=1 Tax=Tuber melanosporum (strain Mel28) TaxID=656061 RepID=D5GN09_TUBMM|nr:uncharacterized protein GSTUM_00011006001 [Tuber melanosporum]CAZ85884.1 unnamed protein product [Tuber melanosporum]
MAIHTLHDGVTLLRSNNDTHIGLPTDTRRTDLPTQLVISTTLGLGAFLTFCFLRPRWSSLYAARKKTLDSAASLPNLPKTFFGWIPVLWEITDEQVLSSAGLDAYVFLSFFKMSIRFLSIAAVLALGLLMPIHLHFDHSVSKPRVSFSEWALRPAGRGMNVLGGKDKDEIKLDGPYLWAYVVFVYLFTALAVYLLLDQTKKVLAVRQKYLGNKVTVTDRTVRLSGIPKVLRSEDALKEYIEGLRIGRVDSVTICRNWAVLDRLMAQRRDLVRQLEEVYVVYSRHRKVGRDLEALPFIQPSPPQPLQPGDEETQPLLNRGPRPSRGDDRPKMTIRVGLWGLKRKKVDAIDYLRMKLKALDEEIIEARKKEYEPSSNAFVTMESVASAAIVIQAVLDPRANQMTATQAPAPPDIVWKNTYRSRSTLTGLAGLLNLSDIRRVLPGLADLLEGSPIISSLIQNFLPTAVLTLFSILAPYFYDWLSNCQGQISQGDVELSLISKNFFFTFFNVFFAFTTLGTAFTFNNLWEQLKGSLSDTTTIAYALARSLGNLASFYVNLIILQGIGMFPFRLLQFGSVALYPIMYAGAKTPRDFADLARPSTVLPAGGLILGFGWVYFVIGYFTYKYQLLYSMDHPQHSTGQAWSMIFYRVILGLFIFQLAMAGFLAINHAFTRSLLIVPLLFVGIWLAWMFSRIYVPLNKFIALKVVREPEFVNGGAVPEDTVEEREKGERFINPNLVTPLEDPWVTGGRRQQQHQEYE